MPNYYRGWEIYWDADGETIRYRHNGDVFDRHDGMPCKTCGALPTLEGHDGCLGILPGVKYACCGHGVCDGYILFENGVRVTLKQEQGMFDGISGMNGKREALHASVILDGDE